MPGYLCVDIKQIGKLIGQLNFIFINLGRSRLSGDEGFREREFADRHRHMLMDLFRRHNLPPAPPPGAPPQDPPQPPPAHGPHPAPPRAPQGRPAPDPRDPRPRVIGDDDFPFDRYLQRRRAIGVRFRSLQNANGDNDPPSQQQAPVNQIELGRMEELPRDDDDDVIDDDQDDGDRDPDDNPIRRIQRQTRRVVGWKKVLLT